MAKIGEIELVSPIRLKPHDLAHGIHECRLPIGRQAHDLVLVTVVGEAQILGQRLVEDPKRMREIHPPVDGDGFSPADTPCSAGEVADTIDRDHHSLFERRHMEGRRKMGKMMLDPMHFATETLAGHICRQEIRHALACLPVPESLKDEREVRALRYHIGQLS